MMWEVIEGVSGRVETYVVPEAESHPNRESHKQLVWEGEVADANDAYLKTARVDPRFDIEQRLRHELGLWHFVSALDAYFSLFDCTLIYVGSEATTSGTAETL
jgi:hypothetical protein